MNVFRRVAWGNRHITQYADTRVVESVNSIGPYYSEPIPLAMLMLLGLVLAVALACFGRYRAAVLSFAFAFGIFLLRSAMSTFYHDDAILE